MELAKLFNSKSLSMQESHLITKLDSVFQFTGQIEVGSFVGFSDPIYAEAYVSFSELDIMLDILIVNQTPEMIQSICLEFISDYGGSGPTTPQQNGSHRLLLRPSQPSLPAFGFTNVKTSIKVPGMRYHDNLDTQCRAWKHSWIFIF